ncbi:MAG: hypothetical protein FH761_16525 [Firmicutes bacterium]|nr:hypothetical protein [Bacillota bacterium]
MFLNFSRFSNIPMDEVREKIIGLKFSLIDFEQNGKIIHLEDQEGRPYTIDSTGQETVISAGVTESEKVQCLEDLLGSVIEKLELDESELIKLMSNKYMD